MPSMSELASVLSGGSTSTIWTVLEPNFKARRDFWAK